MLALGSLRWKPQEPTGPARQLTAQAGVTAPTQLERAKAVVQPQSPAIPMQVHIEYAAGPALQFAVASGAKVKSLHTVLQQCTR